MCGITGYWDSDGADAHVVSRMSAKIQHRGPDDDGLWLNGTGDLAFSHRRLSIIDLSPAGHQPMSSPCGRFTIVYNGEIYNHLELRTELERVGGNFDWRGHSDTETLLAALRHWGLEKTVPRLNGMFAFALWDASERSLFLVRDRLGEKPLYYGYCGSAFLFGSELKSLTAHPKWRGQIDRDALTLYMRHNYVPSPWSIYEEIRKLPAAHYLVVKDAGKLLGEPVCYWDLRQFAEAGASSSQESSIGWTDQLESLLKDSVLKRMASDVPLGAFLSGGIDSSTVVALMQAQSHRSVKTFSIGFHEGGYNEAVYASAVARHLGTDHTELYVTADEAIAVIPSLPSIWDEPFSDPSQIPTVLVSRLARNHVTVSLSGDGGDELFCGYNRYTKGYRAWRYLGLLPNSIRTGMSRLLRALPSEKIEKLFRVFPERYQLPQFGNHVEKLADVAEEESGDAYYRRLISHWHEPGKVVLRGVEPRTLFDAKEKLPKHLELREVMMYIDSLTYLPDDILAKLDRASMVYGLEARVPFLDHRVVEFAWSVPMNLKYRDGKGKWLLRELLSRYLPMEAIERPKMGFSVPIDHWLRGPLRDWGEELLGERRLHNEGIFEPALIRQKWDEHISGKRQWQNCLWDVLMFQAWLETV